MVGIIFVPDFHGAIPKGWYIVEGEEDYRLSITGPFSNEAEARAEAVLMYGEFEEEEEEAE